MGSVVRSLFVSVVNQFIAYFYRVVQYIIRDIHVRDWNFQTRMRKGDTSVRVEVALIRSIRPSCG
jgi:hypothetical protein